ncbi:hypothetical protein L1887_42928 [Cichorium endivia]|nr:hypothetical protein L1887_42928 [Cichorium endivia]
MTRTLAETIPSLSLRIPVTDFSDTIVVATILAPLGRGVVIDRRGADERTGDDLRRRQVLMRADCEWWYRCKVYCFESERAMGRRGWDGEVASVRE